MHGLRTTLVFVYGLQCEVILRESYSFAQDTILIHGGEGGEEGGESLKEGISKGGSY